MSLDVSLSRKRWISYDNGKTYAVDTEELYSANITHNLGHMAEQAGIYNALWRPYRLCSGYAPTEDYDKEMEFETSVIIQAKDISETIEKGLAELKARPDYFKQFDSPNGWGMYEHFVPFVEDYLNACKENPEAIIEVSR